MNLIALPSRSYNSCRYYRLVIISRHDYIFRLRGD